jgi:hypothetical protein
VRRLSRLSLLFALTSLVAPSALSQPKEPGSPSREPIREKGLYAEPFAGVALGRGMRFNNPFRLSTQLGDDADSLSLTSSYLDLGAGVAFGDPLGLRHGAALRMSIALQGVNQQVLTPSYLILYPLHENVLGFARAGTPLVFEPDLSGGLELGGGAVWFVTAGTGISAELIGSLFFGAATWERDPSVIPIASLQLGAWFEYEVLP